LGFETLVPFMNQIATLPLVVSRPRAPRPGRRAELRQKPVQSPSAATRQRRDSLDHRKARRRRSYGRLDPKRRVRAPLT